MIENTRSAREVPACRQAGFYLLEYTMYMSDELKKYISDARKLHMTDATIRDHLVGAGWAHKDIAVELPDESLAIPQPVVSVSRQLFMYVASALLPPFGLIWAFKYLRGGTAQGQKIGWVIIVVTIISMIITMWLILTLYQRYFELLSSITEIGI